MSKLFLGKEEKLQIENNVLKENNHTAQVKILQMERTTLIKAFCQRNSKKVEDIKTINFQEGFVEFNDEQKKEPKKNPKKVKSGK